MLFSVRVSDSFFSVDLRLHTSVWCASADLSTCLNRRQTHCSHRLVVYVYCSATGASHLRDKIYDNSSV